MNSIHPPLSLGTKGRLGGDITEVGSAPRENYVNDKSLLLKDVKKQNMSGGSVACGFACACCLSICIIWKQNSAPF